MAPKFILTGVLVCALAGVASAETMDSTDPTFQKFLAMPGAVSIMTNAVRHVPGERLGVCATRFKITGLKYGITKPVRFDPNGVPESGQWQLQAPTDACGTVLNIFFTALGKGDIQYDVGLSGSTKAELQLQLDTIPAATKSVGKIAKDCKLFGAVGASWGGFGLPGKPDPGPGPDAKNHTWWETWTILACDRIYEVPVGFKAVPGDTTYFVFEPKATDKVVKPQPTPPS